MKIENNCPTGKSSFTTKKSAEHAGKLVVSGGRKLRAYQCKICGCWHLTSTYSRENHEIYKNGHKYNRLDENKEWTRYSLNTDFGKMMNKIGKKTKKNYAF